METRETGRWGRMTRTAFVQSGVTLDPFTLAYLACALWLMDGQDPEADKRNREVGDVYTLENCAQETLERARVECLAFQDQNAEHLEHAGDAEQNGHDFFLTRNGHGAGFWDRGYPGDVGEALTRASDKFGERDFYVGDDGRVYST